MLSIVVVFSFMLKKTPSAFIKLKNPGCLWEDMNISFSFIAGGDGSIYALPKALAWNEAQTASSRN